ncbi:MAG: HAD-IA family hydrolase [Candidatus Woesebacteria bacterium]|nr:HAD-IA family hydrolase [Candidatus Woesebacteria bacterium]
MAIKAVAFDLARVFINVKNVKLNPVEKSLSEVFDYMVGNQSYWDWAREKTGLSKKELVKISWDTINKIYELREPDIFEKLPKLKFATASNHVSMIKDWLKEKGVYYKFYCHIISEDIHFMKPSRQFYEVLIERLGEKPEDVLFVDDKKENIEEAKSFGLKTLLYDGQKLLSESILEAINEN